MATPRNILIRIETGWSKNAGNDWNHNFGSYDIKYRLTVNYMTRMEGGESMNSKTEMFTSSYGSVLAGKGNATNGGVDRTANVKLNFTIPSNAKIIQIIYDIGISGNPYQDIISPNVWYLQIRRAYSPTNTFNVNDVSSTFGESSGSLWGGRVTLVEFSTASSNFGEFLGGMAEWRLINQTNNYEDFNAKTVSIVISPSM